MDYNSLLLYSFIAGLFFICLFATIGAVLSRKLNFNYAYLSILSTALYAIIAYEVCAGLNLKSAIIVNSFLALFDSTIGFLLSIWCKSNSGYTGSMPKVVEQALKI